MSATLSLTVKTKAEELARITEAVEDFGSQEHWPPELVFRVNLALEELGVNIMNHGHDEGIYEFDITLTSEADSLTIEIVDDGGRSIRCTTLNNLTWGRQSKTVPLVD